MTNIRTHLQQQYNKLQTRINKAIQSGKFYQYTAYKQQQLQARLQRYALQMRQLATGVAVCAALGVAAPASGQLTALNLQLDTINNPLDTFATTNSRYAPEFVDIDNDGDLDVFYTNWDASQSYTTNNIRYLENTGNAYNPFFVERFGLNNPVDTITAIENIAFVDIDGDGDMDMFGSQLFYNPREFYYYENTGTASAAAYSLQTGTNNPLDSVIHHQNILEPTSPISNAMPSFVDIDNDGDQDCFIFYDYGYGNTVDKHVSYYENTGSSTNPVFLKQSNANNPMYALTFPTDILLLHSRNIQFLDFDKDNDYDAIFYAGSGGSAFPNTGSKLIENTGTTAVPAFSGTSISLLDSLPFNGAGQYKNITIVDIDNDGDLDVFEGQSYGLEPISYYENMDTTIISDMDILNKEKFSLFVTYPNPSNGIINFDKALTGSLKIYNISGQEVYAKELEEAQTLNVAQLESGLFFMVLQTAKERIRTTVLIER